MSKSYPGYSPNYTVVDKVADNYRSCVVLDIQTNERITQAETAMITEALDMLAQQLLTKCPSLEKIQIATQDSFDNILLEGLRLPRK